MSEQPRDTRRRLSEQLLDTEADLPFSAVGRLSRVAALAARSGKLALDTRFRGAPSVQTAERMLFSLGDLKAIPMKVGQILSHVDVELPDEVRVVLSPLQTHSQPMPLEQVQSVIQDDLPRQANQLLAALESRPFAAASVGQVHRATLPDGTRVAVKVQYPGIDKALSRDFGPAAMGTWLASLIFADINLGSLVREVRNRFLEECNYLHEASSQERMRGLFAGHSTIMVPEVHEEYCSRQVLTTTLVEGKHLDDYLTGEPEQEDRDRVGTALYDYYVASLYEHGLYNCDPHPGNYLFLDDGRLAVLDFGATHELQLETVAKLVALSAAVHADNSEALQSAFLDLGIMRGRNVDDFRAARSVARALFGPMLNDGARVIERHEIRRGAREKPSKKVLARLAWPSEFLFLFRVRLGVTAVLSQLRARANWSQRERTVVADAAEPLGRGIAALLRETPPSPPSADEFDVILVDAGDRKIQVIREVRVVTGLQLAEVKEQLESGPMTVARRMWKGEAEALQHRLEEVGGKVELTPAQR